MKSFEQTFTCWVRRKMQVTVTVEADYDVVNKLSEQLYEMYSQLGNFGLISYKRPNVTTDGHHIVFNPDTTEEQVYCFVDGGKEIKLKELVAQSGVYVSDSGSLHIKYDANDRGALFATYDLIEALVSKHTEVYDISVKCPNGETLLT